MPRGSSANSSALPGGILGTGGALAGFLAANDPGGARQQSTARRRRTGGVGKVRLVTPVATGVGQIRLVTSVATGVGQIRLVTSVATEVDFIWRELFALRFRD